jgi:hypothetical protein
MKLRVFRSYEWVLAIRLSQVSFGGRNPYTLKATDTLQQFDEAAQEWANIEIVEGVKPPHPNEPKFPSMDRLRAGIDEAMSRVKRVDGSHE